MFPYSTVYFNGKSINVGLDWFDIKIIIKKIPLDPPKHFKSILSK